MSDAPLRQRLGTLTVRSHGQELLDITDEIAGWLDDSGISDGLLTLFCRHTSASLLIQENAAPAVKRDLLAWFGETVPEDPLRYEHDDEGPDDMPSHIRTALTATTVQIPVADGQLRLGTWQAIYLFEHRKRPHDREIALHLLGN